MRIAATKIALLLIFPLSLSLLLMIIAAILLWRGKKLTGNIMLSLGLGWLWLWSTPVFSERIFASLEHRYRIIDAPEEPILLRFLPVAGYLDMGTDAFKEYLGVFLYEFQRWAM